MEKSTSMRILSLLCVLQVITGYCYFQIFKRGYCIAPNGIHMPEGAELDMQDVCETCSCSTMDEDPSSRLLHCCGYGIKAGVIVPPKWCKVVAGEDGCSIKMVFIIDESVPCVDFTLDH